MIQVKDLTVDELKIIISETVKDSLQDIVEDILALSNEEYLSSIEEARNDYKAGRVKAFEELFDV
jgi:hypothetical protein